MQLFEEKEYWEVFSKDSRNKKATGGHAKRTNKKEQIRRQNKIKEREEQAETDKPIIEEATDDEEGNKTKKYGNGKQRKEQKKQTHYLEELEEE